MSTTSEKFYYIDPNSELANYEVYIKKYFEENLPTYTFATIDEYKGLVCLKSEDSVKSSEIAFRSVNSDYLLNVLAENYGAKLEKEEIFEGIKMVFSVDQGTRELGSSILCRAGLYMYTKTCIYGDTNERININMMRLAMWLHTWLHDIRGFNNDLAKIKKIALGQLGTLKYSNLFLNWFIRPSFSLSKDPNFNESVLNYLRGAIK